MHSRGEFCGFIFPLFLFLPFLSASLHAGVTQKPEPIRIGYSSTSGSYSAAQAVSKGSAIILIGTEPLRYKLIVQPSIQCVNRTLQNLNLARAGQSAPKLINNPPDRSSDEHA